MAVSKAFLEKLHNEIIKQLHNKKNTICRGKFQLTNKLANRLKKEYNIKGKFKKSSSSEKFMKEIKYIFNIKRYAKTTRPGILNYSQIVLGSFKHCIRKGRSIKYFDSPDYDEKKIESDFFFSFLFIRDDIVMNQV